MHVRHHAIRSLFAGLMLWLSTTSIALADPAPLTEAEVRNALITQIELHRMQLEMQAALAGGADSMSALQHVQQRTELMAARGWEAGEFEQVQARIHIALGAIEQSEQISAADLEARKAEVMNNAYLTDEQKAAQVSMLTAAAAIGEELAAGTRHDWPAVLTFRDEIEHLMRWRRGSEEQPPPL